MDLKGRKEERFYLLTHSIDFTNVFDVLYQQNQEGIISDKERCLCQQIHCVFKWVRCIHIAMSSTGAGIDLTTALPTLHFYTAMT